MGEGVGGDEAVDRNVGPPARWGRGPRGVGARDGQDRADLVHCPGCGEEDAGLPAPRRRGREEGRRGLQGPGEPPLSVGQALHARE